VDHLAGVPDNTTRIQHGNPFASSNKIRRCPTRASQSAKAGMRVKVFTFTAEKDDSETPKRNREHASPQNQTRKTPPKKQKGPCASPVHRLK